MYVLPPSWNIKKRMSWFSKNCFEQINQPTDENYVCVVKRSCNKLQFPQIGTLKMKLPTSKCEKEAQKW